MDECGAGKKKPRQMHVVGVWGCVECCFNEKTIKHFTIHIKIANIDRDVQRLQFIRMYCSIKKY
jgi:hypothetical protein